MKNVKIFTVRSLSLMVLALVFSCQNQKNAGKLKPVTLSEINNSKTSGTDCNNPDTLRYNCLEIDLLYLSVEDTNAALKKNVADWTGSFLIDLLLPYKEDQTSNPATVEAAIESLVKDHEVCVVENPNSPACSWSASSNHKTLLNDGQYLTLEIAASSFMGGAHGILLSHLATFDVQSGKQLSLTDLVTDTAAFRVLAEKTFRKTRRDVFQPDDGSEPMEFADIFPFVNPANFGLTKGGIYCHYNPYEVGPYAIGSSSFTLSYEELKSILKIEPPMQAGHDAEPISDLYQEAGDSVVIPTFEIEVHNSPKARQMLKGQNETVLVFAYFSGDPKEEKDRNDIGEMALGQREIELTVDKGVARFEGVKFSKKDYHKLADKDIRVLINVISGRKSSDDNLLDCALLETQASKFGNKRYTLGCQLITENPDGQSNRGIIASYKLHDAGALPTLLVSCDERGKMEFAGQPIEDYDALRENLGKALTSLIQDGKQPFPELETEGCLMGNSSSIQDMYEEVKAEVLKKGKSTATNQE